MEFLFLFYLNYMAIPRVYSLGFLARINHYPLLSGLLSQIPYKGSATYLSTSISILPPDLNAFIFQCIITHS